MKELATHWCMSKLAFLFQQGQGAKWRVWAPDHQVLALEACTETVEIIDRLVGREASYFCDKYCIMATDLSWQSTAIWSSITYCHPPAAAICHSAAVWTWKGHECWSGGPHGIDALKSVAGTAVAGNGPGTCCDVPAQFASQTIPPLSNSWLSVSLQI